jgi:hypothetical protein
MTMRRFFARSAGVSFEQVSGRAIATPPPAAHE